MRWAVAIVLAGGTTHAEVRVEDGLTVGAAYAGEVFTAPGLDEDRVVYAGLGSVALDLDLAKLAHDRLGAAHVVGFAIHGEGLTERLNEVLGVSNNVADEEVRLFEAWLDQPLGPLVLRAGLLSADQEFIVADSSTSLIAATFGIIAMFSYNIETPVYPIATPGASLRFEDEISVRAAIYDGEAINVHGIPTELGDELLGMFEVGAGPLKLGAWHHTARKNGYYAVADRELGTTAGAFARLAVAPDTPMPLYIDAGVRYGLRERDALSLGLAFARSDVGAQTLVELTYQAAVTKWLAIQPDLQLVLTREDTHGVLAARVIVAL